VISQRNVPAAIPQVVQHLPQGTQPAPSQVTPAVSLMQHMPQMPRVQASLPQPAQPTPPAGSDLECCVCIQKGATAIAKCGCAYHVSCFADYVQSEVVPIEDMCCYIHDQKFGTAFVMQHVPGFTLGAQPSAATSTSAPRTDVVPVMPQAAMSASPSPAPTTNRQVPTPPVGNVTPSMRSTPVSPNALLQAAPVGPDTRRQLEKFGVGVVPGGQSVADALAGAPAIGVKTRQQLETLQNMPTSTNLREQHASAIGGSPKNAGMPAKSQLDAWAQAASIGPDPRRQLNTIVESEPPPRQRDWHVPMSAKMHNAPADQLMGSMRKISASRVPQSGNLGAALGVPCVICFGEDNVLKTLHCGYKAHITCLKEFWSNNVRTLCRLTDIRCPAEVAGCSEYLGEADLRGVVHADDLTMAEQQIKDVDEQNRQIIDKLKQESEEYRPMFKCAICLVEHEVEGCCTLPCQHRFCFESLQFHFDIIVKERRLSKLTCPADGCGHNLRDEESIHIFQQVLSEDTYHKLLEFLTRDDPHIYQCKKKLDVRSMSV